MAQVRRTTALATEFQKNGSFEVPDNLQILKSQGLGGNARIEGVLWSDCVGPDAFNFLGGGYIGDVTTFGSTAALGATSQDAGGGANFVNARCSATMLANSLATDTVAFTTTDLPTKASKVVMPGPHVVQNSSTMTFANAATSTTNTSAPYQFAGDTYLQKNNFVGANEYVTGQINSANNTAAALATGAITAPTGGIASRTGYVELQQTVGKLVTTDPTDSAVAANAPNQFTGATTYQKTAMYIGPAIFNDIVINGQVLGGDNSRLNFRNGQDVFSDNIITLNGSPQAVGNDSGVGFNRYQMPNDVGTGDVVNDNAQGIYLSGTVASSSNTVSTVNLGQSLTATQVQNIPGSWIKLIDSANSSVTMVRRIKSVTSAGIATIWVTADNTPTPANSTAADSIQYGMNFTNVPATTMNYSIYTRVTMQMVWVESLKRFRAGSSPLAANTALSNLTGLADWEFENVFAKSLNTAQINGAAGAGPTAVQAITFLNNAMTGVSTINGNPVSQTPIQITIADGSTAPISLPGVTATTGSLFITITPMIATGSRLTMSAGTNGSSPFLFGGATAGNTSGATTNERLAIQWLAGSPPQVYHRIARSPATANLVYTVYYQMYT